MTQSSLTSNRRRQRELGAYYTPAPIVRYMLRTCFDGPLAALWRDVHAPLRLIDPACGDGAFLLNALERLQQREHNRSIATESNSAERYRTSDELIARHLFGVDIDLHAIRQLRQRLVQVADPESGSPAMLQKALTDNFRVGDALTGDAFRSDQGPAISSDDRITGSLEWGRAFPQIAEEGGFDLVIGNPPYRSEKNGRRLLQHLAESELGQSWHQPRMDLWHYFLHRGLDLLRPGGVLCYIVSTYWMSSRSARRLIDRLQRETTVREIVLLGASPVFGNVSGQHMILQLQKGQLDEPCRVVDCSTIHNRTTLLASMAAAEQSGVIPAGAKSWTMTQRSLFFQGRMTPMRRPIRAFSRKTCPLSELFEVRQGIAENPPFVTRTIQEITSRDVPVGSGVFVLTGKEIEQLNLSTGERLLLRPYYAARSIDRYELPHQPTHWILYLTRETAPDIAQVPHIAAHLARFRSVLDRRREVRRGCIDWWHLHWPREERLFTEPRILAVQMGRWPRFVYAERPTFVNFSVNVICNRQPREQCLRAATAVLNSAAATGWFEQHAKRRGAALDLSCSVLREFPFPQLDDETTGRLSEQCMRRQSCPTHRQFVPSPAQQIDCDRCRVIEHEIERLIS